MYDLLIRNGTVIDGSGHPGYRADVAIQGGRIAAIGDVSGNARHVIDADGHVVPPGFIDGHTHLDAQMHWDPLGSSSCWQDRQRVEKGKSVSVRVDIGGTLTDQ